MKNTIFKENEAFSSFSVDDLAKAKEFYGKMLGLDVKEEKDMGLKLSIGSITIFIYQKENHEPATFTVLNLPVDDIDNAVEELENRGVEFEHYEEGMIETDEKGIARGKAAGQRPDIAWFRDPAGNFISILEK